MPNNYNTSPTPTYRWTNPQHIVVPRIRGNRYFSYRQNMGIIIREGDIWYFCKYDRHLRKMIFFLVANGDIENIKNDMELISRQHAMMFLISEIHS